MKWIKGEFKICVNEQCITACLDTGKRTGYMSGPFGIASDNWTVTHIPSGRKLVERARTFREAKEIVSELMPLADWENADPLHALNHDAIMQVRNVVNGNA